MLPTVHIGPLTLPAAGLILLLFVWIGLSRGEKTAPRFGLDPDKFYNLALVILVAGILGARLGYALRNFAAFVASPGSVISLSPQMLSLPDGILIGALAGAIYAQRLKISPASALDALTPALAILMVGVHLANLASGAAFGTATRLPWGIHLWGEIRHPTQLYEALAAALILLPVWPRSASRKEGPPGLRFAVFIALTALARLLLEFFRGDGVLLFGGLRAAQVAAWVIIALCAVVAGALLRSTQQSEAR